MKLHSSCRTLVALVTALVLVLSACGGSDTSSPDTGSSDTSSSDAASGSTTADASQEADADGGSAEADAQPAETEAADAQTTDAEPEQAQPDSSAAQPTGGNTDIQLSLGTAPDAIDDACDVVTGEEFAAIIGQPVSVEAQPKLFDDAGGCNYDSTPDGAGLWRISYTVAGSSSSPNIYIGGLDADKGWEFDLYGLGPLSVVSYNNPGFETSGVAVFGDGFSVDVDAQGPLDSAPYLEAIAITAINNLTN